MVDANAQPLLDFSDNEVYGATFSGLTVWWLGTYFETPVGNAGVVNNFTVWNISIYGIYLYQTHDLTIDGYVARGSSPAVDLADGGQYGIFASDYIESGLVITNANIQGFQIGILSPADGVGETLIENSYLRDLTDIVDQTPWGVGGGSDIQAHSTVIQNVVFDAPPGMPLQAIAMWYSDVGGTNVVATDQVFVYDYDGIAGDDFQVYYTQQAPDYVVPATADGQPDSGFVGAPVAGLTNEQLWSQYGLAIAGGVAPDETTMDGIINGYVAPL